MGAPSYRNLQYAKFSAYGFLKNLRFFEPFLLLFFLERGISYLEIGSLFALREISINLLEVPTGVVADGLGRRRTMVFSFASYLLSFGLFLVGQGMAVFIPAMLLYAMGDAFRTGTHKAMIMTYLGLQGWEDHKTDYYGRTRSWSQIGSAVSAVIAAVIVFYSGSYARVFLLATVPYALDLLLILSYPKELDGPIGKLSLHQVGGAFRALFRELDVAARTTGLLRTVCGASLFAGFYKGAKDYLQPLISALALATPVMISYSDKQRSAVFIGAVYSVLYVLTSAASRQAGSVARAIGNPLKTLKWEMILGLCVGLGVGVFQSAGRPLAAVLLFFLIYIIQNLRRPVAVAVVSDAVDVTIQATALSVESQAQSLFAALVAFGIGAVAQATDGRVGLGLVAVSLVLLAAAPMFFPSGRTPP